MEPNYFLSNLYDRLDKQNPYYNKGSINSKDFLRHNFIKKNIDQYKMILPKDKNIKILDIGVGRGWFAAICILLGYKNIYLADFRCGEKFFDIKNEFKEIKQTYDIKTSVIDTFADRSFNNRFDFIHLSHVIEHIPKYELILTMDALYKMLAFNGQLMLRTPNLLGPNAFNSLFYVMGHEYGFIPSNLRQLYKVTNFENITVHKFKYKNSNLLQLLGEIIRKIYLLNAKIKFRIFEGYFPESVENELIMTGQKK